MSIEELRQAVEQAAGLLRSIGTIQESMTPLIAQARVIIEQSESVITQRMIDEMAAIHDQIDGANSYIDDVRSNIPDLSDIENHAREIIEAINYLEDPEDSIRNAETRLSEASSDLEDLIDRMQTAFNAQQTRAAQERAPEGVTVTAVQEGPPTPAQPHPGRQN